MSLTSATANAVPAPSVRPIAPVPTLPYHLTLSRTRDSFRVQSSLPPTIRQVQQTTGTIRDVSLRDALRSLNPTFVTAPTRVVRAEIALVVATKSLDGATTLAVVAHPRLFESVPFTRSLTEVFGPSAGVALATVVGIAAVVAVAEFGKRFCDAVHDALGTESPYPCIAQHVTYLLSSTLFAYAFVSNLSLLV